MDTTWRNCTICKNPIRFSTKYWTCSVSTCTRSATDFVFCSVLCWDGHLPLYRHRKDVWAVEQFSPSSSEWETMKQEASSSGETPPAARAKARTRGDGKEILVVVSKLKKYIDEQAGMNTSQTAMPILSDYIRKWCDQAIEKAKRAGRKTLMDRDF